MFKSKTPVKILGLIIVLLLQVLLIVNVLIIRNKNKEISNLRKELEKPKEIVIQPNSEVDKLEKLLIELSDRFTDIEKYTESSNRHIKQLENDTKKFQKNYNNISRVSDDNIKSELRAIRDELRARRKGD